MLIKSVFFVDKSMVSSIIYDVRSTIMICIRELQFFRRIYNE